MTHHETQERPASGPRQPRCAAVLAAALVAGAGLFVEPAALAPDEQAAIERLLDRPDAHLVGEASICCVITPRG